MSRPLGERQISCLRSMVEMSNGIWNGVGWVWDTVTGTAKIMDSLARRGLVTKREDKAMRSGMPRTYYQITAAGRAAAARPAK